MEPVREGGGGEEGGGAGGPYRSLPDPRDEGPDEPRARLLRVVSRLAALYEALGRGAEASALRARAASIRAGGATGARRSGRR